MADPLIFSQRSFGEHEKRAHHITEATMLESLPMSRPRLELRTEQRDGEMVMEKSWR